MCCQGRLFFQILLQIFKPCLEVYITFKPLLVHFSFKAAKSESEIRSLRTGISP